MVAALVLWLAAAVVQAEPAPPPPQPPPPATDVSFHARAAYRAGEAGSALGPRVGFSVGIGYHRRLATVANRVELGAAADLFHDRFARGVQGSAMVAPGVETPYDAIRVISQTSFAALGTAGLRGHRIHAWLGGGAGLTVGYFSTAEAALRPGAATAYQPIVRAAAACAVVIRPRVAVIVRGDYSWVLTRHRFSPRDGGAIAVFGDFTDVGVGVGYRF